MINTILAKERASIPANTPGHPDRVVVHYDIPILPRVPLHVGQEVHIHVLRSCQRLFPEDDHQAPPRYTSHPSGVAGTVIAMSAIDDANTEVVVRNESPWSEVTHALLSIQHIPGVTVQPSLWQRLVQAVVLRPIPRIREIPLELDAVVYRSDARLDRGRTPPSGQSVPRDVPVEPTHGLAPQLGRRGGRSFAG